MTLLSVFASWRSHPEPVEPPDWAVIRAALRAMPTPPRTRDMRIAAPVERRRAAAPRWPVAFASIAALALIVLVGGTIGLGPREAAGSPYALEKSSAGGADAAGAVLAPMAAESVPGQRVSAATTTSGCDPAVLGYACTGQDRLPVTRER